MPINIYCSSISYIILGQRGWNNKTEEILKNSKNSVNERLSMPDNFLYPFEPSKVCVKQFQCLFSFFKYLCIINS